jgi:hypothetical protein
MRIPVALLFLAPLVFALLLTVRILPRLKCRPRSLGPPNPIPHPRPRDEAPAVISVVAVVTSVRAPAI